MASDIGFVDFVALWNARNNLSTPALHEEIAAWLEARWRAGDRKLLLMVFRGAGKSTLVGLFSAWLLAHDPEARLMVLAADLALAKKMLRHVRRVILRHPICAAIRPTRPEQWAADQCTVERQTAGRDPSMLAKGIETNLTGSRADVIICDDVEVPNTSDTIDKRVALRARLAEIDYVLVPGGLNLYVGTPHSHESIYAAEIRGEVDQRPFLEGFARLELPLLDASGASLWPDRYTKAKIEEVRRRSGPAKFASQMMLRPLDPRECRLDPARLVFYESEIVASRPQGELRVSLDGRVLDGAVACWDPAFGAGAGDGSAFAIVYADGEGRIFVHRVVLLAAVPDRDGDNPEAEQQCRRVVELLRECPTRWVVVETNGLGAFLPAFLRRQLNLAGLRIPVINSASRRGKDARILEAFDARLAAGLIHVHASVRAGPFLRELREWRPSRSHGRDDAIDAVAGAILSDPVRLGPGLASGQPAQFEANGVFDPLAPPEEKAIPSPAPPPGGLFV